MLQPPALDPLSRLGREPVYNTHAVAQRTGVPANTFRAWERRYGVPRPSRATGNQRLYSEFDIGLIDWLRDRTTEGMQISRAVQRLKLELPNALGPARSEPVGTPPVQSPPEFPQTVALSAQLLDALLRFDELRAAHVIDEALALFTIEHACARVLHPTVAALDERWRRGDISTSQQHFAAHAIGRRLSALFDMLARGARRGTLVAACAPGDDDEVALQLLGVCLARRGWRMLLLGAGVPTDDLAGTVRHIAPELICVCVGADAAEPTALAAARELSAAADVIVVVAVVGNRAVPRPNDTMSHRVHVVHGDPYEQALAIEQLVPGAALARGASRAYTP